VGNFTGETILIMPVEEVLLIGIQIVLKSTLEIPPQINRTYNGRSYSDGSYSRKRIFNWQQEAHQFLEERNAKNRNSNNPFKEDLINHKTRKIVYPTTKAVLYSILHSISNSGRDHQGKNLWSVEDQEAQVAVDPSGGREVGYYPNFK
jgi:hypothetical protein